MATVRREIVTRASPDEVWAAIRDVGALHTRLVPGFVIDTRLEGDVRIVTFASGMVAREPIVTIDEQARRLVWSAEGGMTKHYNASVQVLPDGGGASRVVWIADFLPDGATPGIASAIAAGMAAMQRTLDSQAASAAP
jgi:carbon monoxide dehydrogenase subunit G